MLPGFRQHLSQGWYQLRIAGKDTGEGELSARLHEPLPDGAVIHLLPRTAGAKNGGVFQIVAGAVLAVVGYALSWTGVGAVIGNLGVAMMLG
ncbi:TPA: tail assembly protein, partial [Escherichia coli]|nr:tail assembly protein [Escherichia coli]